MTEIIAFIDVAIAAAAYEIDGSMKVIFRLVTNSIIFPRK